MRRYCRHQRDVDSISAYLSGLKSFIGKSSTMTAFYRKEFSHVPEWPMVGHQIKKPQLDITKAYQVEVFSTEEQFLSNHRPFGDVGKSLILRSKLKYCLSIWNESCASYIYTLEKIKERFL